MGNLYEILGVNKKSNKNEIKKAYYRLALKYHPDKNNSGLEDFKKISHAYQLLSDPILRKKYDEGIKININLNNPYDILDIFYKDLFTKKQIDKIKKYLSQNIKHYKLKDNLKDKLSVDLLYGIILDFLYQKEETEQKKKTESIYVDVTYNLKDHFSLEFNKKVFIEVKNKGNKKKIEYNIDTRKQKYFFKESIFDKIININLNVIALPDPNIKIIDTHNSLIILKISLDQYLSGFYYKLNIYETNLYLYFRTPEKSNLIYKLNNKGIPISTVERGNLYFKLQLTKDNVESYSFFHNQDIYSPEIVNFF